MRKGGLRIAAILLLLLLLLLPVALAWAQGSFGLTWWTVDGGGGRMSNGDGQYVLRGTAGQADAGTMSGGSYVLQGGFWGGAQALRKLFLPSIRRP